jgi:GLPGLI family protein
LMISGMASYGQTFFDKGKIEFEVKTNNHKAFGDGMWADIAKERFPKFSTSYYDFIFNENRSIYKFNRYSENSKLPWGDNAEDNIWYNDYNNGVFVDQKFVFDDLYILSDSLAKIEWKIDPKESREIAGFSCRKAVGKIFDSVYVFVFYTDEITISGGPMGLSGLPGMILGVTIPRMFTSWIATKVELNGLNYSSITAPSKGKKKKAKELKQTVQAATKDWGSWGQRAVWEIFI